MVGKMCTSTDVSQLPDALIHGEILIHMFVGSSDFTATRVSSSNLVSRTSRCRTSPLQPVRCAVCGGVVESHGGGPMNLKEMESRGQRCKTDRRFEVISCSFENGHRSGPIIHSANPVNHAAPKKRLVVMGSQN